MAKIPAASYIPYIRNSKSLHVFKLFTKTSSAFSILKWLLVRFYVLEKKKKTSAPQTVWGSPHLGAKSAEGCGPQNIRLLLPETEQSFTFTRSQEVRVCPHAKVHIRYAMLPLNSWPCELWRKHAQWSPGLAGGRVNVIDICNTWPGFGLWSACPCCKDGAHARHPLFTARCNMITVNTGTL